MPVPSFVSSLGAANVTQPCTPGAELWLTPGGTYTLTFWINAGFCDASGFVTAGPLITPRGFSIQSSVEGMFSSGWAGATLFQDTRPIAGDGGSSGTPGTAASGVVVMQPGEFTPEQSAEIYASMFTVFGAFLALVVAIRGYQFIVGIFNRDSSSGSD